MRASFLIASAIGSCLLACTVAGPAGANPIRLHGTAAAAHGIKEFQDREFGWGVAGLGAAELGLSKEFGLELELSGLWLSQGDEPKDPNILRKDSGAAGAAALGFRVRPFASAYHGRSFSAAGLWLAANGGVTTTGGMARPMFDAQLGFDFLYARGKAGLGPMIGYLQVFQPDSEFRPEDANIGLIGIHAMFDTSKTADLDGDADRDGIRDSVDKCPYNPEDKDGFEDEDGCPEPDNDKDGILDAADRCPNDPEDKDGFEDQDGCPELDNDKDGLLDNVDKCPNDPEDKDGFEDEDGCPDPDNDQDGIPDVSDVCPNEPETKNGYADQDGCPDEEQVRVLGDKIVLDDRVHFRTNNATIRIISYPLLQRLAKLISDHPEYIHIDIEGHADERGTEAFNQKLSEDRAKSVLEFLVKQGVARERLSATGFGTTRPLVPKRSEYAWLLNRRVEFRVTRQFKYKGPETSAPAQTIPPEMKDASDVKGAQDDEKVVNPEDKGDPEGAGGADSKDESKKKKNEANPNPAPKPSQPKPEGKSP